MIIHVRNFGKIESADIDISNFSIFVGENNSGKSYLMQLIYGVISFLFYENDFKVPLTEFQFSHISENTLNIYSTDKGFLSNFQKDINNSLDKNKNKIIENIFHTKNLTIDELKIELDDLLYNYSLSIEQPPQIIEEKEKLYTTYKITRNDGRVNGIRFSSSFPEQFIREIVQQELSSLILSDSLGISAPGPRKNENKSMIYLPASRSGIMLLYANYLANDNNGKSENHGDIIYDKEDTEVENEYGLTEPVYNFLMFLLKHKDSELASEANQEILSFIDDNIINGNLSKVGNSMHYTPKGSDQSLPIYLSSSLVSELAPICQILSGVQRFNYILYDEIETCQHPTKQLQLARLIVRMVNSGYKMIVSTHSDTMAAAINNLITLSLKKNKKKIAEDLGYTEDDLLKSTDVHAYQFLIENGKTKVKELSNNFSIGVGFDFDLFNKTNDKIYHDALKIVEEE